MINEAIRGSDAETLMKMALAKGRTVRVDGKKVEHTPEPEHKEPESKPRKIRSNNNRAKNKTPRISHAEYKTKKGRVTRHYRDTRTGDIPTHGSFAGRAVKGLARGLGRALLKRLGASTEYTQAMLPEEGSIPSEHGKRLKTNTQKYIQKSIKIHEKLQERKAEINAKMIEARQDAEKRRKKKLGLSEELGSMGNTGGGDGGSEAAIPTFRIGAPPIKGHYYNDKSGRLEKRGAAWKSFAKKHGAVVEENDMNEASIYDKYKQHPAWVKLSQNHKARESAHWNALLANAGGADEAGFSRLKKRHGEEKKALAAKIDAGTAEKANYNNPRNEETLDEISKLKAQRYISKAVFDYGSSAAENKQVGDANWKRGIKRYVGIDMAAQKLGKGAKVKATESVSWAKIRSQLAEADHSKGGGAKRAGLEAGGDEHIISQLQKAKSLGSHDVKFKDKSSHPIDRDTANHALSHYHDQKGSDAKVRTAERLHASHASFHDTISGKADTEVKHSGKPSMPHGFKPKGLGSETGGMRDSKPAGGRTAKRISAVAEPKNSYRPD